VQQKYLWSNSSGQNKQRCLGILIRQSDTMYRSAQASSLSSFEMMTRKIWKYHLYLIHLLEADALYVCTCLFLKDQKEEIHFKMQRNQKPGSNGAPEPNRRTHRYCSAIFLF